MRRADPVLSTRRTTLVGGVSVLAGTALSGCGTPSAPRQRVDPDVALLIEVVAAVDAAAVLVATTSTAHPRLAPLLDPVAGMHAAHRTLLGEAGPEGSTDTAPAPSTEVSPRRRAALTGVRRAEEQLADRLREAAVSARSGPLARALASMAAGVTQHSGGLLAEGPRR